MLCCGLRSGRFHLLSPSSNPSGSPESPLGSEPASESRRSQEGSPVVKEHADRVVDRHSGLLLRTLLVSALTLVSRLLGFVREILSAVLFGANSAVFDAFLTAWRVPNLFRRFFGEGALSTSLQTVLTQVDHEQGDEAGRLVFGRTLRVTTWILAAVCAGSMLALFLLAPTLHTGWLGELEGAGAALELAIRMLPFVLLICLAALFAGALAVRGHFFSSNLAPVALNVVWIGSLLALLGGAAGSEPLTQVRWLAGAVLLAGATQLLVQLPAAFRFGLLRSRRSSPPASGSDPGVGGWTVFARSAPLAFGAAVYQINVLVDGLMAESLLPVGGPTAHYYANRIQQFPLALIATATSSAVFPALNALGAVGRLGELRALHDRAQLAVAFLAFPASFCLLFLAPEISAGILEHGKFEADGAARVASALGLLGLALLPAGAAGLASRVYYSLGDLRTPVRLSCAMLIVNLALNAVFLLGLDFDVEGLAAATALTSWLHLLLLLPGMRRLGLPRAHKRDVRHGFELLVTGALAGLAARAAGSGIARVAGESAGPGGGTAIDWAVILGGGITAALVTLGIARWQRFPELDVVVAKLARRRSR